MKKSSASKPTISKRNASFRRVFFLALAWLLIASPSARAAESAPDSGGISDAAIRDMVTRVARHQLHPLADGDYPVVQSVAAAQAAKVPEGIIWSYPWGVTLYGLLCSTEVTGDTNVSSFVVQHNQICARDYAWLSGLKNSVTNTDDLAAFIRGSKIKSLISLGNLDSCGAMGNEILESMIRYPDQVTPEEKQVVGRIAEWVTQNQARLPDGTLWRPKSMNGTLWPDDLYMGGVFLVRWGVYTHDQKFIDDAANQIIHQAALEEDTDGLWYHGYFMDEKKHAPFKWGRGNGWVTVTLVETLSAMPKTDPLRAPLLKILREQIAGLKKVQSPDGMWRQVLDQPDLWDETSCTAMFAYGIARAVNRGWIDASEMTMARRAFAGIARNVTVAGVVKGTCEGTNIGRDLDYYRNRPRPDDDLHGRGVTLLAGTEILLAGRSVQ